MNKIYLLNLFDLGEFMIALTLVEFDKSIVY